MNNVLKNGFYSVVGLLLIGMNNTARAAIEFGGKDVDDRLKGSTDQADTVIERWLAYLVGFLYLAAVIMMIYGAFNILTAAGEEEKVKKGKTILMQAVAGIIVVFIANSIVMWVIEGLFKAT